MAFSEYMNFKNLHRKEVHTSQNYTANILWESFIFQCKFVRLFYLCFRWKTLMKPFASTMKPCTIFASVLWNLPTLLMEIWTIWFPWPCQVKFFFSKKTTKNWENLANFCGLIRNHELYDSTVIHLINDIIQNFSYFRALKVGWQVSKYRDKYGTRFSHLCCRFHHCLQLKVK